MPNTLDSIDKTLLRLLQKDSRQPVIDLADAVGLSVPACYKRINKLRQNGCIDREVAVVSPKIFGWTLRMIALVILERERGNMSHTVIQKLKTCDQVTHVSYVAGEYDFVVVILARDMEEYDALTNELFQSDMNIRRFETLVVMREVK